MSLQLKLRLMVLHQLKSQVHATKITINDTPESHVPCSFLPKTYNIIFFQTALGLTPSYIIHTQNMLQFIFFLKSPSLVEHSHLNKLMNQIKANKMIGLNFITFVIVVVFSSVLCSGKIGQQHSLHPDLDTGHIHPSTRRSRVDLLM